MQPPWHGSWACPTATANRSAADDSDVRGRRLVGLTTAATVENPRRIDRPQSEAYEKLGAEGGTHGD